MQVTTFSTQLGLGSELVDWYRDATSVPFGHLLLDLSPRTDGRLRYCTNTGSIGSKFHIPDRLKLSKLLDDEHTKSLYSPIVPINFPQRRKLFPSVLPKRVYPVSLRVQNKSAQRKPAKHKKTSLGKISKQGSTTVSKRTIWKQRRDFLASERGLQLNEVILLPSLTICLDMEQFVLFLASGYNKSLITQSDIKQELPKYQPSQNSTYEVDSLKEEINKKLFSKADILVGKIVSCPSIRLSNSRTLILDGVETGISLLDFAQHLRRKNADIPDIFFTLLDAAGIFPTLILNQNAKAKERGSWVHFRI